MEAEASAVVTRAGAKRAPVKSLKVQPSNEFGAVTTDALKQAQVEDPTLKSCWESSVGTMSSDPDVRQVVIPQTYRAGIMRLTHESIVGGHLMAKIEFWQTSSGQG